MAGTAKIPAQFADVLKVNRNIPARQPIDAYYDFSAFVEKNSLAYNPATMEIWSLFSAARNVYGVPVICKDDPAVKHGDVFGSQIDVKGTKVFFKLADKYPTDAKDANITEEVWMTLQAFYTKAPLHIAELVGAYQVGGLRERNFESYFKMSQAEIPVTRIMSVIHFLSMSIPKIIEVKEFQLHTKGVNWLVYHTAAASTQQLMRKFIDEAKDYITIDAGTRAAVEAACDSPWDKSIIDKIPTRAVAYCYVYLEAAKQLPDNWYQGIKAVSNMATVDRVRAKSFFRAVLAKLADTDKIEAIESVDDLKAEVPIRI